MANASSKAAYMLALLLVAAVRAVPQGSPTPRQKGPAEVSVAMCDMACTDHELGRIVTETLETELLQSTGLRVIEAARVRKSAAAAKVDVSALSDPDAVVRLARRLTATHVVTGSCFVRDQQLILTVRLLDGSTGSAMRGGGATAEGRKGELLPIVRQIAGEIEKRLGAVQPVQSGSPDTTPAGAAIASAAAPDEIGALRAAGLAPADARPSSAVSEKDLASFVAKVAKGMGRSEESGIEVLKPTAPVSRIRALAALVRLVLTLDNVEGNKGAALLDGPPDERQIAPWARPFVVSALGEGWWDADRPLRPLEPATWTFVAALAERMSLVDTPVPTAATGAEACSGLVLDARELQVQRSPSTRILDEDGKVVYPDAEHLPNMDFVQQHGLAAYSTDVAKAGRAGAKPLRVKAVRAAGPGQDDLVVSADDADHIRAANRSSRFLWRWSVVVLVRGAAATTAAAPATPPPAAP